MQGRQQQRCHLRASPSFPPLPPKPACPASNAVMSSSLIAENHQPVTAEDSQPAITAERRRQHDCHSFSLATGPYLCRARTQARCRRLRPNCLNRSAERVYPFLALPSFPNSPRHCWEPAFLSSFCHLTFPFRRDASVEAQGCWSAIMLLHFFAFRRTAWHSLLGINRSVDFARWHLADLQPYSNHLLALILR